MHWSRRTTLLSPATMSSTNPTAEPGAVNYSNNTTRRSHRRVASDTLLATTHVRLNRQCGQQSCASRSIAWGCGPRHRKNSVFGPYLRRCAERPALPPIGNNRSDGDDQHQCNGNNYARAAEHYGYCTRREITGTPNVGHGAVSMRWRFESICRSTLCIGGWREGGWEGAGRWWLCRGDGRGGASTVGIIQRGAGYFNPGVVVARQHLKCSSRNIAFVVFEHRGSLWIKWRREMRTGAKSSRNAYGNSRYRDRFFISCGSVVSKGRPVCPLPGQILY